MNLDFKKSLAGNIANIFSIYQFYVRLNVVDNFIFFSCLEKLENEHNTIYSKLVAQETLKITYLSWNNVLFCETQSLRR